MTKKELKDKIQEGWTERASVRKEKQKKHSLVCSLYNQRVRVLLGGKGPYEGKWNKPKD